MRDGRVFNWRAGIVVVIFLVFILYPFRNLFTVYENIQEKISVNDQLTLYITQVEASSLSRNTFHFYLYDARKSTEEFMSHLSDIKPVMITNDAKATATVTNGEIYLRVRGNIYAFTAVGFDVPIHLDRSAD
ncbi:hypothetical protein [Enterobacter sichuanensis]|uniref:Uncharacterized protein n=1 Tax=Enterobacter sichuanensis TaxID=2071710 RepID=A0A0F1AEI6_9ENTR|nr:hypothetical protein [Enterobacter sichuanensis]KJN20546.1 hypothetical protein SS37_20815 [Enterobacter sichuanensis]MBO2911526.1 hypothetical protein [Enterobacter sichuanensis]MBO2931713.1 hypothetical protein [Enterobacter sichuanensis]HED6269770.1 hypothetical protein [Enterobacter sichuanensis]HEM8743243.1 hypothetical protein [Enterobacter sichuanensis]